VGIPPFRVRYMAHAVVVVVLPFDRLVRSTKTNSPPPFRIANVTATPIRRRIAVLSYHTDRAATCNHDRRRHRRHCLICTRSSGCGTRSVTDRQTTANGSTVRPFVVRSLACSYPGGLVCAFETRQTTQRTQQCKRTNGRRRTEIASLYDVDVQYVQCTTNVWTMFAAFVVE